MAKVNYNKSLKEIGVMPDNIDIEMDGMFADVDEIDNAAQQIMKAMVPPKAVVPTATNTQQAGIVAAPPSQPKQTDDDRLNEDYKKEKIELLRLSDQLSKLANSDTNGEVVRNFGMSQLVISVGGDFVRLNGLVVLRALKARCKIRTQDKKESKVYNDQGGYQEEISQSLYEVWGEMEDDSLGLTSSYLPAQVVSIIDLNSGYDVSPDE